MALCALGGLLALYALGAKDLAADEATSYFIAHLDWARLWRSLTTSEANGSLFYVALHYWIALGETETVLRTLPAFFAAATVPVAYLLGSRLLGTAQGPVAAALLATNAFFISHAQEVRSYSLSALLATVSTLFFVQVVDGRSRAGWEGT